MLPIIAIAEGLAVGCLMFLFCILAGVQSTAYNFLFMILQVTALLSASATTIAIQLRFTRNYYTPKQINQIFEGLIDDALPLDKIEIATRRNQFFEALNKQRRALK